MPPLTGSGLFATPLILWCKCVFFKMWMNKLSCLCGKILAKAYWLHWNFCCILWSATFMNLILYTFPKLMHKVNPGDRSVQNYLAPGKQTLRVSGMGMNIVWAPIISPPPAHTAWPKIDLIYERTNLVTCQKYIWASQNCKLGQQSEKAYSNFQKNSCIKYITSSQSSKLR